MRPRQILGILVLSLSSASPLCALFHEVMVTEVFAGTPASPNAQYVELRAYSMNQNFVSGHPLRVYDANGTLLDGGTFTFTGSLMNGANQMTILIATVEAAAFFDVAADLTMAPVLPLAGGKVCWDTFDCVAWGGYVGDANTPSPVGTPFNAPAGLLRGKAIHRDLGDGILQLADDTNDSAADFSFDAPSPVNNAGASGALPGSACGNGTVESLEGCDDGNATAGDGCSATCQFETDSVIPQALVADPSPGATSNGNGVIEPGETFTLIPSWKNQGASSIALTGAASTFSGLPGFNCAIVDGASSYATISAGAAADCMTASGNCYQLSVSNPMNRPSTHVDRTLTEVLSNGGSKSWLLHIGASFTDVPVPNALYRFIETIFHAGITAGCGPTTYCPGSPNTRGQMAVFLLKASDGSSYTPPACVAGSEIFGDVAAGNPFCPWIEELSRRGITAGCGSGNYCPGNPVSRGQMAVFLLKTSDGSAFLPPACAAGGEAFDDVAAGNPLCRWIEELKRRGITAGCGPTTYCPGNTVTRGQMAVFLTKTFDGLQIYGPLP